MVQAYHFLASWQLFPERGMYELGERPKSGTFRMSAGDEHHVNLHTGWVTLENQALGFDYRLRPDGDWHRFTEGEMAEESRAWFPDGISMESEFRIQGQICLEVGYRIMPDGYLRILQKGFTEEGDPYTNTSYYHKQLSVLPYSASVSGAVIKPTEEGVIRHKALSAMEEQTNMQLEQIRKQIELLALQAQDIQNRKELSMIIYGARLSFSPVIGQVYHLYEKADGSHILSMISPREWGGGAGPFRRHMARVRLLADHTWVEVQ
jgi:hypothetical protein